jgi:ABC-type bacteriocin/lantibiotic exporter with double-glycine peptidase domain
LAHLHSTVKQMPNGFNTMIGDRSEENLSDGQTQRLSLARGFLKDAEVMMMDEPTSGKKRKNTPFISAFPMFVPSLSW